MMKKIIFIIFVSLLIGVSVYTVNRYNSTNTKENTKKNTTENTSENTTENTSQNTTQNTSQNTKENISQNTSENKTENTKDQTATKNNEIEGDNSSDTSDTFHLDTNSVDEKALDFTLKDLKGNEIKLSDLKGKKVFLNFWATWCPPCRLEMPEIEELYQETKNSDLVIVSVEIGEPLKTVKSFIQKNKYHFQVLLDLDQSVTEKYAISSIPTSYFINEDGYIVAKRVGAMNINEMKEYIKKI